MHMDGADPDSLQIELERKWGKKFSHTMTFDGDNGQFYVSVLRGVGEDGHGFRRDFIKFGREWTSRTHYMQVFKFDLFPGEVVETGKRNYAGRNYYVCAPEGNLRMIAHTGEKYDGMTSTLLWDYVNGRIPLEVILKGK